MRSAMALLRHEFVELDVHYGDKVVVMRSCAGREQRARRRALDPRSIRAPFPRYTGRMGGMAFGECEGYCVVCHTAVNPTDDEWAEYLLHLGKASNLPGVLVITAGGVPNSAQRKDLAGVVPHRKCPIAIVTASPIARGVITALGWLGISGAKAFAPAKMDGAIEYLGVDRAKRRLVLAELARVEEQLRQTAAKTG